MTQSHNSTNIVEWKSKTGPWSKFPSEFKSVEEAKAHIEEVVNLVPAYRLYVYRITSTKTLEIEF